VICDQNIFLLPPMTFSRSRSIAKLAPLLPADALERSVDVC